jgi:hypothetical protein
MMPRQEQTSEGGEAYQAGGNLTVTHGMNADQMAAVMVAMAKHLQVHFTEAEAKLEERLTDFRKAVLEEFSKPENKEATEAFKDPDFQFVLDDAQKVFARDGTAELRDDLVRLLVQRSSYDSKDRTAKILNHSIEIAGSLSRTEYAALAVNFLLLNVKLGDVGARLLDNFSAVLTPLIPDLSENPTLYEYLEAQRCVTINYVMARDLSLPITQSYASALSSGFTESDLAALDADFDRARFNGLVEPSWHAGKPLRFVAGNVDELANNLQTSGMSPTGLIKARELFSSTVPAGDELMNIFDDSITGWDRLKHVWENTALSKMNLTAIGKTIAHSTLSSKTPFSAPLSIWVS